MGQERHSQDRWIHLSIIVLMREWLITKGNYFARQYMPNKPATRCLKIFMRCDAEGNCYDYWPYIWKHGLFYGRSSGDRVVKHQCRPLKYKVYHVFYDRLGRLSTKVKKSWSKMTDATWPTSGKSMERQENGACSKYKCISFWSWSSCSSHQGWEFC